MYIDRNLEWELRKGMPEPMEETSFDVDLKSGGVGRRTLQRSLGEWGGDILCKGNNTRNELFGFQFQRCKSK